MSMQMMPAVCSFARAADAPGGSFDHALTVLPIVPKHMAGRKDENRRHRSQGHDQPHRFADRAHPHHAITMPTGQRRDLAHDTARRHRNQGDRWWPQQLVTFRSIIKC